MKKSIKKIAATLLAATMSMGLMTTAFAADIVPEAGKTVYTIGGAMTTPEWNPGDDANAMVETEFDGVYKFELTAPVYDETAQYKSRFSICALDDDSMIDGAWRRILLGNPEASKYNDDELGYDCLTQIRIECAEETPVTLYFDSTTYALVIRDAEGKDVPYHFAWASYDDKENFYTVDELCAMSFDEYTATLIEADRKTNLADMEVTALPDFKALNKALNDKLDGVEPETTTVAPETTTVAPETTTKAPETTTAAPTTTPAATTTAKNQATQTGDVAPVALFVLLASAVAVVTVAAKKKEA